jgi:PKD repeat protein
VKKQRKEGDKAMDRKVLLGIGTLLVSLIGIVLVCVAAGDVFINDSGFTANAFRIVFSSAVRITDYGRDIFPYCTPRGEGKEFLFTGGKVVPGNTFWLNWERRTRSEVKVVKAEWLQEVPSEGNKETVPSGKLRILFDQTRLQKLSSGSYTKGVGYEYAIEEMAGYGASHFAELLQDRGCTVQPLTKRPITQQSLKEADVLLIIEPSISAPYTSSEVEAIRKFVEQGGGLFLVCRMWRGSVRPSGGADPIARAFGVSFKDNGQIHDPTDHAGSDLDVIRVSTLLSHPVTGGVKSYYYQGTYLDELGGTSVLARSDEDSWFDHFGSNDWGDHVKQPTEESGPFPVLAAMEYGEGRLVFAGDATIMMNDWIGDLDAEKLALNIIGWLAFLEKEPPVARFSVAPTQPMVGLYTTFDASPSSVSIGAITDYTWRFGDGSTGSGKHITHVYNRTGKFTVTLTVINDYGASDSTSKTITIIKTNASPQAGFTYSPQQPTNLNVIQFTDQSTDPDGQVVKWHWDFGDGNASTEQNPSHRYEDEGTYKVTLTVTDDDNASNSTSKTITVIEANQPPQGILIDFPELVPTGAEVKGAIGFRDPDGDVSQAKFEVLEGALESFTLDLTQPPYAEAVRGKTEGSFDFTIKVDQPGQYRLRVTLIDDAGLTSEPKEFSFEARTPTAPAITKIVFPSAIKVNEEQNGIVKFEDPDGDVVQAELEVLEGDPATIEVKPGMSFDPGVQGQTKSSFRFSVIVTKAQTATLRLTLIDSAGLKSEPYEFSFEVK